MQFQIKSLLIWPKSSARPPRSVDFELGKVNVITGASRTGKSAIIPIIDYCLASSDCHIPIDTIRDHASWYGVVFQTEAEQLLIARKVPEGNKSSNEFYVSRGSVISVPPTIEETNINRSGVQNILNSISAVPSLRLHGTEGDLPYQGRLSFRDLMALVFQNQDIVANQNIMFYKTHAHEHRERLRLWFPFIIGAVTTEVLLARQRLESVEKRLGRLKREVEKAKSVSSAWVDNMIGHLRVAEEYGILGETISEESDPEELIDAARNIVDRIPNHSRTTSADVEKSNEEVLRFTREQEDLSSQIGTVKKRLSDLKRLESGLSDYRGSVRRRADRLHVSQWLESVAQEKQECPACGSDHHPKAGDELRKISSAFRQYEEEAKAVSMVPDSFRREEGLLKIELDELFDRKNSSQNRYDLVLEANKEARDAFQLQKNMFLFLGHLRASLETFEKLVVDEEFSEEIAALEEELTGLRQTVNLQRIQRKIEAATDKISQGILTYLKGLDVENKYRETPPKFSIEDLSISVRSNDGHWHFLAEVGSASNWVSFHLALMCSLQDFFISQQDSPVPSFVIFDQPSQVYFPKLVRDEELEDGRKYGDGDVGAVRNMFKTLASSVLAADGKWQSIVLDHADSDIYGDIEGVHEVEIWRDGTKLIPEEWYVGTE